MSIKSHLASRLLVTAACCLGAAIAHAQANSAPLKIRFQSFEYKGITLYNCGLIPSALNTDLCPASRGDGHNAIWLCNQSIPSDAASVFDLLVILPNAVAKPIAAQILPDVFDGIEFG